MRKTLIPAYLDSTRLTARLTRRVLQLSKETLRILTRGELSKAASGCPVTSTPTSPGTLNESANAACVEHD
jgi:hypothetical protein